VLVAELSSEPPLEEVAELVDQAFDVVLAVLSLSAYEELSKPAAMPLCEPLAAIQASPVDARVQCTVIAAVAVAWPLVVVLSVLAESPLEAVLLVVVTPPKVELDEEE
jgi:hypothetical protein